MAKRFTDTELWNQDWFIEMPSEYKLFYFYVKDACDHAGIFKVNLKMFCYINGVNISAEKAVEYFNKDKLRIYEITSDRWLLVDFFAFQYGHKFNFNNKLHESVRKILEAEGVSLNTLRGIVEDLDTPT